MRKAATKGISAAPGRAPAAPGKRRAKTPLVPVAPAKIDRETLARLRAVAEMPDDQINLADPDAPLVTDWRGGERGKFFKPVKRLKSFRIDADVLAYFEAQGKGYQAIVNRVLRDAMLRSTQNRDVVESPSRRTAKKT